MNLPEIPDCRKWTGNSTPEQDVFIKLMNGHKLDPSDIEILDCGYTFLEQLVAELKLIDATTLNEEDVPILKEYLRQIFNMSQNLQNVIDVGMLHRMIWVRDFNEEDGKIRNSKFLSNTPVEIVRNNGWYGRANSNNSTCLYLAESAQTAVFECKPEVGDRIVLIAWRPKESIGEKGEYFNQITCYPINSVDQINDWVNHASNGLQKALKHGNPYVTRIIKLTQEFIGHEFTKDVPILSDKKYEYFFSAYFADLIWKSEDVADEKIGLREYDGISYPSVANSYRYQNIALRESSVSKFEPFYCEEMIVEKTGYEFFDGEEDHLPIEARSIRKSVEFTEDRIVWDDD